MLNCGERPRSWYLLGPCVHSSSNMHREASAGQALSRTQCRPPLGPERSSSLARTYGTYVGSLIHSTFTEVFSGLGPVLSAGIRD